MQQISSLAWLDDLERQWLSGRYKRGRIEYYESILGRQVLNRIVIGDRQIGHGFVSGGRIPKTRLIDISRDQEAVKRYLIGLLDYLFDVFRDKRPSLVFLYGVAGAVSIAIAEICAHMGIPVLRLAPTRIGSRYMLDDSAKGLLNPVKRLYEKSQRNVRFVRDELEAARTYIRDFRNKPEKPEYARVNHARIEKELSLSGMGRTAVLNLRNVCSAAVRRKHLPLRSSGALEMAFYRLSTAVRARSLLRSKIFERAGHLPQGDFVYFPLHIDPEASTMVLTPMHTDQTAVIEALVKSLPLDLKLVVKEHIPMLGRRPPGFYERIFRMPGVVMASPFVDNMSLVRRASATCVISGTSAWEAILLQKPALIIGDSPYLALGEGCIHCPDLSRLPKAVADALSIPPARDDNLALFIAALLKVSFEFPTELLWGKVTADTVRQHPQILKEMCDRILQCINGKIRKDEFNRLDQGRWA